jgi:hypothetical protein
MSDEPKSSEQFKHEVEGLCGVLTSHGFKRAVQFESESPTTACVVYLGRNLAFTFTFDVRDQAVDLIVTRHRGGKLVDNWDGGYSSSLFTHLLNHCGFRGRPTPPVSLPEGTSKMKRMIAAQVNLLSHPSSGILLADGPDALPR